MHPAAVKLLVMLLLLVQGLIATSPGRVLCISIGPCIGHATLHESGDSHGGSGCGGDHNHGPTQGPGPDVDSCTCHVHVQLPVDERAPVNSNPRSELPDARPVEVPLLAVLAFVSDCAPQRNPVWNLRPPDLGSTAQVLGLLSTRLII